MKPAVDVEAQLEEELAQEEAFEQELAAQAEAERRRCLEVVAQAAWPALHGLTSERWARLAEAYADLLDAGWEPEEGESGD